MLQAMGLGGWMFDGIDRLTMLGASGDPDVPGLGFRYDTDERWALPNPTGLRRRVRGVLPAAPRRTWRAAVEAFAQRKFGPGGPFHPATPGAWRRARVVRGSAQPTATSSRPAWPMAQYIFDRFGKFPGTVPSSSS